MIVECASFSLQEYGAVLRTIEAVCVLTLLVELVVELICVPSLEVCTLFGWAALSGAVALGGGCF